MPAIVISLHMAADNCFGDDDDDDNDASGIQRAATIYATRYPTCYLDFPLPYPNSTQSRKALPVKLG